MKIGVLPAGAQELASEIMLLKYRAGTMGLWKTMHALEPATQAVGWEMASILAGERNDHLVELRPDECCIWIERKLDIYWDTACGIKIEIFTGTPSSNGYRFCPNCGKAVLADAPPGE